MLDTDASIAANSGKLYQEQEWNGKTVLRPIGYGSKVLSDTEMKYGAPKAEMFAVVTFVEKYRTYLGSKPFKLRVGNTALSWLKMYSMDQSYIGRWIVRLDVYNMIIEHRTRDKHQDAVSLSKRTEFYERQEQRKAERPEIKDGSFFMDKETYDTLLLTDKSGKPIEDHPDLANEHRAKEILERNLGLPMEIMLKSKTVRETLKAKDYDLDEVETVEVTVGEDLRKLLERLADDKPVVSESGKDRPEVTIMKRGEVKHDGVLMKSREPESKEVVRTIVERVPEEVIRRTTI